MADLVVPQLGESITEAVVSRWLKQVGDAVGADEPVAELETDKVTVELPSPVAGTLGEQRAAVGKTVRVGEVIGAVTAGAVDKPAAAKAGPPPPPTAKSPPLPPDAPTLKISAVDLRSGNGARSGEAIERIASRDAIDKDSL